YRVKSIEPVAVGSDVQARLFTLAPGEAIPWHFHSSVTDWYFVLQGTLSIETRAPVDHQLLALGATYRIPPKTAHLVANRSKTATRVFCSCKVSELTTFSGSGVRQTARRPDGQAVSW